MEKEKSLTYTFCRMNLKKVKTAYVKTVAKLKEQPSKSWKSRRSWSKH